MFAFIPRFLPRRKVFSKLEKVEKEFRGFESFSIVVILPGEILNFSFRRFRGSVSIRPDLKIFGRRYSNFHFGKVQFSTILAILEILFCDLYRDLCLDETKLEN